MMISLIQSNCMGFGSGVVVPCAGVSLQNRGHGFTLDKTHPNIVGGGKRPFHTIIPGFLMRDGRHSRRHTCARSRRRRGLPASEPFALPREYRERRLKALVASVNMLRKRR
jgi:hypothetical protein